MPNSVLVIDSHKSAGSGPQENLHWLNARLLADELGGDLIWSYKGVNDSVRGGYEKIVFVHASHYAFTDYAWLEASPDADLFYVSNEYNLGEPRTLWMAVKRGRKYTVLANHPARVSKIVQKYVLDWRFVNLNALSFRDAPVSRAHDAKGCVYYGSFRANRSASFAKYLHAPLVLSTHRTNADKFRAAGATSAIVPRLRWDSAGGLEQYAASLYIEDEVTHSAYNCPANRFYEALNYSCTPLIDAACAETFRIAGYEVPAALVVDGVLDVARAIGAGVPPEWRAQAAAERRAALTAIKSAVLF